MDATATAHVVRTTHTNYKYRLRPTPAQQQALETVVQRCRTLYNTALEQRKTWWDRGQGRSASYYQQKAELPDLKVACPEYTEVNAQVLQDVLLRYFHHKVVLALLSQYDTVYLEGLRIANLVRNPYLAKRISDAGWAQFRTILEGKAVYAGRRVLAVPPAVHQPGL